MSPSAGIPADAVAFYAELEASNTKWSREGMTDAVRQAYADWWTANKERYEHSVREPFAALTDALADEFGESRIFRPYRDVRFSADKTPYKTEQGAIVTSPEGTGDYVRVGSDRLTTGPATCTPCPTRWPGTGQRSTPTRPGRSGWASSIRCAGRVFRSAARRSPRARRVFPPTIPDSTCCATRASSPGATAGTPAWMSTGSVVRYVRDDWRSMRPMVDRVRRNVGPTSLPTPAIRRR